MGSISRYLLAPMLLGLVVPFGGASAQSPTTNIETEYLMTLEGNCDNQANKWGNDWLSTAREGRLMDQR